MAGEQVQFDNLLQNLMSEDNKIRIEAEVSIMFCLFMMTVTYTLCYRVSAISAWDHPLRVIHVIYAVPYLTYN